MNADLRVDADISRPLERSVVLTRRDALHGRLLVERFEVARLRTLEDIWQGRNVLLPLPDNRAGTDVLTVGLAESEIVGWETARGRLRSADVVLDYEVVGWFSQENCVLLT